MSEASSSAALEGGRRNALIPIAQTDWPSCSYGGEEEEEAARRMLLVSPEDYFVRERPTSLGQSSRRKKGAEKGGRLTIGLFRRRAQRTLTTDAAFFLLFSALPEWPLAIGSRLERGERWFSEKWGL